MSQQLGQHQFVDHWNSAILNSATSNCAILNNVTLTKGTSNSPRLSSATWK